MPTTRLAFASMVVLLSLAPPVSAQSLSEQRPWTATFLSPGSKLGTAPLSPTRSSTPPTPIAPPTRQPTIPAVDCSMSVVKGDRTIDPKIRRQVSKGPIGRSVTMAPCQK